MLGRVEETLPPDVEVICFTDAQQLVTDRRHLRKYGLSVGQADFYDSAHSSRCITCSRIGTVRDRNKTELTQRFI